MPEFDSLQHSDDNINQDDRFIENEDIRFDEDHLMEQILDNLNNTPIGQVLKKITSLPEVRREKVLDMRTKIHTGQYDVNKGLDIAIDKVLEDIIS